MVSPHRVSGSQVCRALKAGRESALMPLVLTPLQGIPLVEEGDNLCDLIRHSLQLDNVELADGDVIVIAQKIVSKAEGRRKNLRKFPPTDEALRLAEITGKDARFVQAVLEESKSILRAVPGTIIAEHHKGFICANAGIDHSNIFAGADEESEEWILLLPEDPDHSAEMVRMDLEQHSGKQLAVLIIDSHGRPWRNGTVGVSIGVSGMPALLDLRGKKDLFGRILRITQLATADELAAAASLMMGQAAEGFPVVHVRGFPYELREGCLAELIRPEEQDLFR